MLAPNAPLLHGRHRHRAHRAHPAAAAPKPQPAAEPPVGGRAARYAWARLLAHDVFPLVCPQCAGEIHIIAFITYRPTVRGILAHLGEPTAAPWIAPAR